MDAKSISKKIKSKGLQRLRWYCQMCQKQCRDENGFKNHCTTEKHLQEMERFSQDSKKYVEKFSREFEKSYLDLLSHHHHTKRMNANYVYTELIQDKSHIHMNATRWESLASFIRYLGETGKCIVDETEQGWFVKWIDPEEQIREIKRKEKQEREFELEERRMTNLLNRQKQQHPNEKEEETIVTEYNNDQVDDKPVILSVNKKLKKSNIPTLFSSSSSTTQEQEEEEVQEKQKQQQQEEEDYDATWLIPEIIVKIISSKVGNGHLKNEKAVIVDVNKELDEAMLIILKTGEEIFSVPSKRLETVIPKINHRVMIVNPKSSKRGCIGKLIEINQQDSKSKVSFPNGEIKSFEFEDISKVFEEEEQS